MLQSRSALVLRSPSIHRAFATVTPVSLGALVAAGYTVAAFRRHDGLMTGMDLTIFDQAVRALAHGQAPVSAMKHPGMNLWGDHFHPGIVVLAPLYWLWDDPRVLLLAQAVLLGAACTVLARAAARRLTGVLEYRHVLAAAITLAAALAVASGVQSALTFDFHEVALGILPLALACSALLDGRWRAFASWTLLLLAVKEDMGLIVVGLAAVAWLLGRRRLALALGASAVAWTAFAVRVAIPALSPVRAWAYADQVASPGVAVDHLRSALLMPGQLTVTIGVVLLGTAFLALRSPLVLAALPQLLARGASGHVTYLHVFHHYSLLISVIAAFAALDGLTRVRTPRNRVLWMGALAAVVAAHAWTGPARSWLSFEPNLARLAAARAALAVVPAGEPIATDVYLTPHASREHLLTQQIKPGYTDGLGFPVVANWIVLDRCTPSQGGASRWVPRAIADQHTAGFVTVRDDGCFVVLRR